MEKHKIAIFQKKEIRKTIYNDEWWFAVVDVCGVLTGIRDQGAYWRKLKQRLKTEGSEVVTNCHGLKLEASDGKRLIIRNSTAEFLIFTSQVNTDGIEEKMKMYGLLKNLLQNYLMFISRLLTNILKIFLIQMSLMKIQLLGNS